MAVDMISVPANSPISRLAGGTLAGAVHDNRVAAANTGFYVQVRDIDSPKWRVPMSVKATQQRWMELLRQELNEGGVAGPEAHGAGSMVAGA